MVRAEGHGGRDSPDYIQGVTPHQNPIEITLAELAIRLGFPHVYERTGNVIYYDTFAYGIGDWFPTGSVAANYPVLSSHGFLDSPYSCKFVIAVSGGAWSSISKTVAYPYITTCGMEVTFRPLSAFGYFTFGYQVYTGTYCYSSWCRHNNVDNKWAIYDETGAWEDVASYSLGTLDISVWHPVKMVIDFEGLRYARFSYDENDLSLTEYPLNRIASNVTPRVVMTIGISQVGTELATMYVDNVILTINEPL